MVKHTDFASRKHFGMIVECYMHGQVVGLGRYLQGLVMGLFSRRPSAKCSQFESLYSRLKESWKTKLSVRAEVVIATTVEHSCRVNEVDSVVRGPHWRREVLLVGHQRQTLKV